MQSKASWYIDRLSSRLYIARQTIKLWISKRSTDVQNTYQKYPRIEHKKECLLYLNGTKQYFYSGQTRKYRTIIHYHLRL